MTVDTTRLRELAEVATPGPWTVIQRDGALTDCDDPFVQFSDPNQDSTLLSQANAAYIAAADPATVLALLDLVDKAVDAASMLELIVSERNMVAGELQLAQQGRERLHHDHEELLQCHARDHEQLAAAQQEIETLRRFLTAEQEQCARLGSDNVRRMQRLGVKYPNGLDSGIDALEARLAAMTAARNEACDGWEEYAEETHRSHEHDEWPRLQMERIAELRKVGAP